VEAVHIVTAVLEAAIRQAHLHLKVTTAVLQRPQVALITVLAAVAVHLPWAQTEPIPLLETVALVLRLALQAHL
jgi:hypothetical protein